MFIVSSVFARVLRMAETRSKFTPANSKHDSLMLQPKRLAVEHMASNNNSFTLRSMRFGGFNTFSRWNLFENNWYANLKQASEQRQALESKLADAHNAAAEQNQQCKSLKVELAVMEKQKREELKVRLANTLETATKERHEALEDEIDDALEAAIGSEQQCEVFEADIADALDKVKEPKQDRESLKMAFENERSANAAFIDDAMRNLNDGMYQADQRRRSLESKIDDALKAAVGSKQQYELLELELVDALDEAEDLKQQCDALGIEIEKERSINVENLYDRMCRREEVLHYAERRCRAQRIEIEDTLKAAVGSDQQFELLDFGYIDALDEVEELKRQRDALAMAIEEELSTDVGPLCNRIRKRNEDLYQARRRCQTLIIEIENAHKTAARSKQQYGQLKFDLEDALDEFEELKQKREALRMSLRMELNRTLRKGARCT
ncbi:hypothetical protein COEREDRAFT_81223 [Coemansia reversa NRRL 1564]|uniref:Uncharacterized protein n=1 Tax=Coemansia reversa (strain ATCC 12441 / NRRL 1564) TaxID=763665 RepID=A0A2G5BCX3_COERN|nr:hypothetical protein COEREDRAFT_81223 [Coemansia reversa NRRL 1564]|eukprot:PIA16567.1 hypothetical protein COEREDRAFT_81223 [Coemansia reversa NRRL 1564]